MAVYLDLLALINFAFNFVLLAASGWLGLEQFNLGRYAASALAGTVFWFIFFFSPQYILINWLCRAAGGLAMAWIAWRPAGFKGLFTRCFTVLVVGQLVGGGIYSLLYCLEGDILGRPGGVSLGLAAAGGGLGLAVAAWWAGRIHRSRHLASHLGQVTVTWGERTVSFSALLDSGNTLRHPLNSWPVVLLERRAAARLLEEDLLSWLESPLAEPPSRVETRVALIPFVTLGGQGLLGALRPDRLTVALAGRSRELTQVYIALEDKGRLPLEYEALAFPIDGEKEDGQKFERCG